MIRFCGILLLVFCWAIPAGAMVSGSAGNTLPNVSCLSYPGGGAPMCCSGGQNKDLSGDNHYSAQNFGWCNIEWHRSMRKLLGISKSWWGGHGWEDWCNTDRPMGQLQTGLMALLHAHPFPALKKNDRAGQMLRWGLRYVVDLVDETKARCYDNIPSWALCVNCFNNEGEPTWVELPVAKYFMLKTYERGSTLIHEARHWEGADHAINNESSPNDGKDSRWGLQGAWQYEITWLREYATSSVNVPRDHRCYAAQTAINLLNSSYIIKPTFIPASDKVWCRLPPPMRRNPKT